MAICDQEGFKWLPMITKKNGLICKLDVLMLRPGHPGQVVFDIDNRLKTLFDALRRPGTSDELGERTARGKRRPEPDENPFYVLLEDDSLITHLSVTTDTLLEPLEPARGIPPDEQVRLVIGVNVRPYRATLENSGFA